MPLTEYDDVVEQILAHELNPFLRDSVLPRAAAGSPHDLRAHSLERPDDLAVELEVAVEDEVSKQPMSGLGLRGQAGARGKGAQAESHCVPRTGSLLQLPERDAPASGPRDAHRTITG
jgi:hypothetical protein